MEFPQFGKKIFFQNFAKISPQIVKLKNIPFKFKNNKNKTVLCLLSVRIFRGQNNIK